MTALVIGIGVVALVIVIAVASQRSGPRVTHITRTVEHKKEDDD